MDAVNEAMRALKQVALQGKNRKELAEKVDSLATTLRLLDTSLSADSQIFGKLVAAVREPFVQLYEEFPPQAFQLSAAIFSFLFYEKIIMQLTAGNRVLQSNWEGVSESLLSGILDFLEARSDAATLRTLASVLYPVLCRICFSTAFCSSITMGSNLRYTAFMLLVDSADEPTNKEMLRDSEYLGSRRLGATLYGSKDYVILENLFLLVLIVAPKFDVIEKRNNFLREVFVMDYSEETICGENIARILAESTEMDSDLLQAQAIDVLAKSNLMFPQPFDISQIDSCGLRFPQKPPQQRLIIDYKSLLANVIKDEGYESFRVSFDQIHGISFSTADTMSFIRVVVRTSSAPTIQSRPLKVPDGQSPSVTFEIRQSDVLRFKRALGSRGLAGPPRLSVMEEGQRLEFNREGDTAPDILVPAIDQRKVQEIDREMQLSQQNNGSPMDGDDRDCEDHLLFNGTLLAPSTHAVGVTPQEETAAASRTVSTLSVPQASLKAQKAAKPATTLTDAKLTDVTPRPKAPRYPSVFVPATPSQNKHKDVFGSDVTDLSEPSDGSDVDSMKALSQKVAARADSLIAITKPVSILADTISSAVASRTKAVKRRVLDSDNEEALLGSRKGVKGNSKSGAGYASKTVPTAVGSDGGDLLPPPAPLKRKFFSVPKDEEQHSFLTTGARPKPIRKNAKSVEESPGLPIRDGDPQKRKREDKDDDSGAGGILNVQEKPPPTKRARKTTGRKPATTRPKAASPAHPRDSQVLKKPRPAAKKNANYSKRANAARISSPTRDPAALPDDGESPHALDLRAQPVEPRVESPLVDDDDDDDYVLSPPAPKPKPKSKVTSKRKPALAEKSAPPENLKATTVKPKAKAQTGTRARVAAAKAKGVNDEGIVKAEPPQKVKVKGKRKPKVVSADDGKVEEEGGTTKAELTKDTQVFIEVSSSPPEPPISKRKAVSRVTSQEERVKHAPETDNRTTTLPAPEKKVILTQGGGDSQGEEVTVEPGEVDAVPGPSPRRSTPTEKSTKMPTKPISEQVVSMTVDRGQDDHLSESTKAERLPVAELSATNDLRLAEVSPAAVAREPANYEAGTEVEEVEGAVVTVAQDSHEMDLEPDRFDPIVVKSPMKVQTDGIEMISPVRVREVVESDEPRLLEINADIGGSPEDEIHDFVPPQPIMDRMPVGVSPPKEGLRMRDVIAQSTPTTLSRGPQQFGQGAFRKPKVTFATTPFKEKEAVRCGPSGITPGSGGRRKTVFEDNFLGRRSSWERTPEKGPEKHTALIGVLDEIQNVIVQRITRRFEAVEEETRFARNDVHSEALNDFKKMHSQRAIQFNALVDLEAAYAARENKLKEGYENGLAVNAEMVDHVRQGIREHDGRINAMKNWPKTLRRPMSALMRSYL